MSVKSAEFLRRTVFDRVTAKLQDFPHFTFSRRFLAVTCLILACLIGYLDYRTGYERSLLLFYLLPVSLAAWFGNFAFGLAIAVVCVVVSLVSDVAAGIPAVRFWNIAMSFGFYVLFAGVLWKLGSVIRELDRRVHERTAALQREMAERRRLDQEIARVADRERRRLGQDLHDRLGQHLTGTALAAQVLKEKLAARSAPEVAEAEKLVCYVDEGIDLTRSLARGFFSPELDAEGLMVALQHLAESVSERFRINCVLHGDASILIHDRTIANQLYRIAQEAVTNSVKHGAAKQINIRLAKDGPELCLTIIDDGIGFPDTPPKSEGLGLRLMQYGAAMTGATFDVRRNGERGTIATFRVKHIESQ
jgi:signal transduction histidine kinase